MSSNTGKENRTTSCIRTISASAKRTSRTGTSVSSMPVLRKRLSEFLFPAETDNWLAALRLGLGLQITLYSLSLRNDWNYLLSGTNNGLINRNLAEALLSVESHLVPRLG